MPALPAVSEKSRMGNFRPHSGTVSTGGHFFKRILAWEATDLGFVSLSGIAEETIFAA